MFFNPSRGSWYNFGSKLHQLSPWLLLPVSKCVFFQTQNVPKLTASLQRLPDASWMQRKGSRKETRENGEDEKIGRGE